MMADSALMVFRKGKKPLVFTDTEPPGWLLRAILFCFGFVWLSYWDEITLAESSARLAEAW
jgi:hypothetical protein